MNFHCNFRNLVFIIFALALVCGCATRASLTVFSLPEGAAIIENDTGKSVGSTPVTVFYDPAVLLQHRDDKECFVVKGFEARWVSGAVDSIEVVRLCGSDSGDYKITFYRDPDYPDLEKDIKFSLKLQAQRSQQQQDKADKDSVAAKLHSAQTTEKSAACCQTRASRSAAGSCR